MKLQRLRIPPPNKSFRLSSARLCDDSLSKCRRECKPLASPKQLNLLALCPAGSLICSASLHVSHTDTEWSFICFCAPARWYSSCFQVSFLPAKYITLYPCGCGDALLCNKVWLESLVSLLCLFLSLNFACFSLRSGYRLITHPSFCVISLSLRLTPPTHGPDMRPLRPLRLEL